MRSQIRFLAALLMMAMLPWSLAAQQQQAEVTIYNNDRALVREIRPIGAGSDAIRLAGIAETLVPESLWIEALGGAAPTWLQYNTNLVSPGSLLPQFIGKTLTLVNNREQKPDERVEATLLSAEGRGIWRIGEQIVLNPDYDSILFPGLPAGTVLEPSIEVRFATRPAQVVLQYLAAGLRWKSDYMLSLDDNDRANLRGLFTVHNQTSKTFENTRLNLVAGDVRIVSSPPPGRPEPQMMEMKGRAAMSMAAVGDIASTELGDYYLYALPQSVTLLARSQQQIPHFAASAIAVEKEFRLENQYWLYPVPGRHKQNVAVIVRWDNTKVNQLGFPLPGGVVRTFGQDEGGRSQFLGESTLKPTPENERVELEIGRAFDILAERRQIHFERLGERASESENEVEIRNRRKKDSKVRIIESIGAGDWKIVSSTHPYNRLDVNRVEFVVTVPASQTLVVRYRVQARQ